MNQATRQSPNTAKPKKPAPQRTTSTPKFEMLKSQKNQHIPGAKFEMSRATNETDPAKPKFEMLKNKAAGTLTGYF